MAIDTASKRLSALQVGAETTTAGMPMPSGAIDQPARATMLWIYAGFSEAAAGGVVGIGLTHSILLDRRSLT